MKKRIIWITPDYFYDTDSTIVGKLCERYEIRWYVIWGKGSLIKKPVNKNIYRFIEMPYRNRDIRIIRFYISLINEIKKFNPEVLYNGLSGLPFFYPLLFCMFDKRRIIHEGHEVDPFVSVTHDKLTVSYVKYYLKRVGHTHVFSKHAEEKFHQLYPGQECTYVPMVPKDYGKPRQIIEHGNKTVFLFFGGIRSTKRFDVLLNAFLALNKKKMQSAELWVYGKCEGEERKKYEQQIAGIDNIKAMFDFVPDELIPDVFNSASYLVQPYQQITQSGPMMIAFNYGLPIIATDIEGFKERIEDGKNGFLFKKNDVNDLKRVLEHCISQSKEDYNRIKDNSKLFVEKEYSPRVVITKYQEMLDRFIAKNGK